jgi:hypothetical protein
MPLPLAARELRASRCERDPDVGVAESLPHSPRESILAQIPASSGVTGNPPETRGTLEAVTHHRGETGGSLGSRAEMSPARRRRERQRRKREEKRWARKSGPVTVRFVDPAELREEKDS